MSQIPPPPPGQPTPSSGTSGVGTNKNLYTILAWALLPPIGSLVLLFVGKDDPDVKSNAAAATVIHGPFLIVAIVLSIVFFPLYLVWPFRWFVVWLVALSLPLQASAS